MKKIVSLLLLALLIFTFGLKMIKTLNFFNVAQITSNNTVIMADGTYPEPASNPYPEPDEG